MMPTVSIIKYKSLSIGLVDSTQLRLPVLFDLVLRPTGHSLKLLVASERYSDTQYPHCMVRLLLKTWTLIISIILIYLLSNYFQKGVANAEAATQQTGRTAMQQMVTVKLTVTIPKATAAKATTDQRSEAAHPPR